MNLIKVIILLLLMSSLVFASMTSFKNHTNNPFPPWNIPPDMPQVNSTSDLNFSIWLASDPQIASVRPEYSSIYWSTAVDDMNALQIDVAFILGDCINGYPDEYEATWSECAWAWNQFHSSFDRLNVTIYKNYTIGNHDLQPNLTGTYLCSWRNMSRLGYDPIHKPYGNYSWQCGNLLFVVLANEDQCDGYGRYTHQIQWFDSLAENNTDKNIIVLSHHPLWGTTHGVIRTIDETESQRLKETLDRNPQVCAWFNGNIHENGGTTFHYNNCTCIDCDSINRYYGTQSFLWILTKENTSTQVFSYNHGLKAITYLTTVSLKYPFSLS